MCYESDGTIVLLVCVTTMVILHMFSNPQSSVQLGLEKYNEAAPHYFDYYGAQCSSPFHKASGFSFQWNLFQWQYNVFHYKCFNAVVSFFSSGFVFKVKFYSQCQNCTIVSVPITSTVFMFVIHP